MQFTSRIEIDLDAVERNLAVLRRAMSRGPARPGRPAPGVCAVLKADAYGMGAPAVARRLEAAGAEMIAVYTPREAAALADAGVTTPLLVLMPVDNLGFDGAIYQSMRAGRVHFALHSRAQLDALAAGAAVLAAGGWRLPVHLEVDTGMSRGGVQPDEALDIARRVAQSPHLRLTGVFSHFASADRDDAFTREQSARFSRWLDAARAWIPPGCAVHHANSFAVFRSHELHHDMCRAGLALLGYTGEEARDLDRFELAALAAELSPAVRWVSRVIHTATIPAGTPVGYGSTWRSSRATRLGLVPVGYADGYPLSLSSKGVVGVRVMGRLVHVPVLGSVSMDQIIIDLTDIRETRAGVGSEVEVVGADRRSPTYLPDVAARAGTITHEFLCGFSPRVERRYLSSGAVEATARRAPQARADAPQNE